MGAGAMQFEVAQTLMNERAQRAVGGQFHGSFDGPEGTLGAAPMRSAPSMAACDARYLAIALSQTACVQAAAPGSFLITGSLPPASRTFTVRW